ncbi:MAG: lysophospholipid acyltransferase family protein [Gemmatimonadaceae bacterium]
MRTASLPEIGSQVPRSGGRVSAAIGRWTLGLMGWSVEGAIPNQPKLVIIAAPHTSNWDFIVGIAAKLALRLQVLWFGKDSLFRGPLGAVMRSLGGMPVDRSSASDVVGQIVGEFGRRERLILALAPEGTRKRVERWRTGFYHIAHGARVPVVPVALNWGARAIQIGQPFMTTGDLEADIAALHRRFDGVAGRRPKS